MMVSFRANTGKEEHQITHVDNSAEGEWNTVIPLTHEGIHIFLGVL